jgi:hypothetical protein
MNRNDVERIESLVFELWPRSKWPTPIQDKFVTDLYRLPIEYEQAKAALVQLRSDKPFQSIQPSDVMKRLATVSTPTEGRGNPQTVGHTEAPLVKRARQICRQDEMPVAGGGEDAIAQMPVPDMARLYMYKLVVVRNAAISHAIMEVSEMLADWKAAPTEMKLSEPWAREVMKLLAPAIKCNHRLAIKWNDHQREQQHRKDTGKFEARLTRQGKVAPAPVEYVPEEVPDVV